MHLPRNYPRKTSRQLKPYVPYKDDKKVPLHYYTDREGVIEIDEYV